MFVVCVSGMIVTTALIIWQGLILITGSESPVVVVLSGSMEPGFKRVSHSLQNILYICLLLGFIFFFVIRVN